MRATALLVFLLPACAEGPATPLGVTLDDGQVLVGAVTTDVVVLEGALGSIEIPLQDIGMILPVEGRTLGDSHANVTVWLRNGSELRGAWDEPELSLGLTVGGEEVPVDVPTDRMQALQLRGSESWPSEGLFRVRTSWGDDFLVDPEETQITIGNDLGTFAPFLSECRSVGPVGAPDGDWRVELLTGTVLVGPVREASIAFALPMGPDVVEVPLAKLVALDRSTWSADVVSTPAEEPAPPLGGYLGPDAPRAAAPVTAEPGLSSGEGWFENERLESAKR